MPECKIVHEAILMITPKNILQIINQSDLQLVVNAIMKNLGVLRDIINYVENVKHLLISFSKNRLKYCNRIIDRNVDKKDHL